MKPNNTTTKNNKVMTQEELYKTWELRLVDDYGTEFSLPTKLKKTAYEVICKNNLWEVMEISSEFSFQTVPGINFTFTKNDKEERT